MPDIQFILYKLLSRKKINQLATDNCSFIFTTRRYSVKYIINFMLSTGYLKVLFNSRPTIVTSFHSFCEMFMYTLFFVEIFGDIKFSTVRRSAKRPLRPLGTRIITVVFNPLKTLNPRIRLCMLSVFVISFF